MIHLDRPCGWVPCAEDFDPRHYAVAPEPVISTALAGPPQAARIQYEEWDPRQYGNSCTGHMVAQWGYGLIGERFSPYHSYWAGARRDQGPSLSDVGVTLCNTLESARRNGLVPWDLWNPDSDVELRTNPLIRPPAYARAVAQLANVSVTRIVSLDPLPELAAAIAHGYPGGLVVRVDEAFDSVGGDGIVPPESGAVRGLHAITPWSYHTTSDGRVLVRCLVHWGPEFGDDGGVYVDRSRIERAPLVCYATDLT